jgi:hypothetical protein
MRTAGKICYEHRLNCGKDLAMRETVASAGREALVPLPAAE